MKHLNQSENYDIQVIHKIQDDDNQVKRKNIFNNLCRVKTVHNLMKISIIQIHKQV